MTEVLAIGDDLVQMARVRDRRCRDDHILLGTRFMTKISVTGVRRTAARPTPRVAPFSECVDDLERDRQARETLRHQLRRKGKPGWKSIRPPRTS